MDELDLASDREAIERESLIASIRRRRTDRPLPDGFCHACEDIVEFPRLFCGVDCAEQWDRLKKKRAA